VIAAAAAGSFKAATMIQLLRRLISCAYFEKRHACPGASAALQDRSQQLRSQTLPAKLCSDSDVVNMHLIRDDARHDEAGDSFPTIQIRIDAGDLRDQHDHIFR